MSGELVLPRPGGAPTSTLPPIPGPSEAAFTETFGTLLPPAKYLTTANGKAAYYEILPSSNKHGSSSPDRVLFIHGVQTPALGMLPLVRALHESFPHAHFVLIDLWGHGLSDTPIVPHDPSLFHQLLDALLDRLEWPSAHLIGYSFGGVLTAGYAASRPSRVRSLVLVAPAGLIRSSDFTAEEQGHLRGDDEVAARKWVIEWLEGGPLVVPQDWKERVGRGEIVAGAVKEWQMRGHAGHVASVVAVVRDGGPLDSHEEFVKAVRTGIPSVAILGETDGICSAHDLKEVGFSNVFIVPQVGHGVVREKVPEVAGFISEFWTGLDKGSSN